MSKVTTQEKKMQEQNLFEEQPSEEIGRIELLNLKLENFKGARNITLELNGKDCSVFGDNSTFKTTCADAFSWLLFNKDSQGHADFEIKTLDSAGVALRGLDHAVEAELFIDRGPEWTPALGGEKLVLRKVYKEKWAKKRGSAEREFSGNTRDHFVNGVPVNQSDYEAQISSLITSEDISKLLTNPIHFAERLHWQERRRLLLEICGDISDDDVIASSGELADLPDVLEGRSLDDHRKVIQARKRKINE